jgi:hypothetical protein
MVPNSTTCLLIYSILTFIRVVVDQSYDTPQQFDALLSGSTTINADLSDISPLNYEMIFYMHMYPRENVARVTGFSEDVQLQIRIFVPGDNGTAMHDLVKEQVHDRIISCPQSLDAIPCTPLQLFHQPYLQYDKYRIVVRFLNQEKQSKQKLFQPKLSLGVCSIIL